MTSGAGGERSRRGGARGGAAGAAGREGTGGKRGHRAGTGTGSGTGTGPHRHGAIGTGGGPRAAAAPLRAGEGTGGRGRRSAEPTGSRPRCSRGRGGARSSPPGPTLGQRRPRGRVPAAGARPGPVPAPGAAPVAAPGALTSGHPAPASLTSTPGPPGPGPAPGTRRNRQLLRARPVLHRWPCRRPCPCPSPSGGTAQVSPGPARHRAERAAGTAPGWRLFWELGGCQEPRVTLLGAGMSRGSWGKQPGPFLPRPPLLGESWRSPLTATAKNTCAAPQPLERFQAWPALTPRLRRARGLGARPVLRGAGAGCWEPRAAPWEDPAAVPAARRRARDPAAVRAWHRPGKPGAWPPFAPGTSCGAPRDAAGSRGGHGEAPG